MEPSPKFSFPSRADLERGCMPDGSLLRFPSRELDGERWPAPLPGKSTVTATAKKQDAPEDCGSIYTPPKGSLPYTGVPCPVPEAPDASFEARCAQVEEDIDAIALQQVADLNRVMGRVRGLVDRCADVLEAHPEIITEDIPLPAAPVEREAALKEPVEREKRAEKPDAEKLSATVDEMNSFLDGVLEDSSEEAEQDVARAPSPVSEEPESHDLSESGLEPEPAKKDGSDVVAPAPDATGGGARATSKASGLKPESAKDAASQESVPAPDGLGQATQATSPCNVPRAQARTAQGQDGPATRSHTFRVASKYRASVYSRIMGMFHLLPRLAPHILRGSKEQRELSYKMLARGRQTDLKQKFVNDRAHAAVSGWLLHLDMAFQDLGFGGWMPFRYADQWLTFVSLTRKLLAANGLITPKGPNHWRKFIEETPEVETEDDPLKLPKSLAPTKKYAAIESISEIIQRAQKKTEHDVDFRKQFNQRFATGP